MDEPLVVALKASVAVFMIGNLFAMGLQLNVREALDGLSDRKFVLLSLVAGFVIGPGIAFLLATLLPISGHYALGLVLLGMAPCAPFLPATVEKARGDMGYTAAFMLLASLVTVVYMPFAVPLLARGFSADAWTIAKPLVFLVVTPLVIGLLLQRAYLEFAGKIHPFVRKATGLVTIIMLILCAVVYGEGFVDSVGGFAIGAQVLFYVLVIAAALVLGHGLPHGQRSVLALGVCTRNLGAAFAPLFAVAGTDERAIVMVALGVPLQTAAAVMLALWLGRREGVERV